MSNRIETGSTEPISLFALTLSGVAATGLTNLYIRLMRGNGDFLDWDDMTFKATGWTTLGQVLTEVDATNAAGLYEVTGGLDTSAITNATTDDDYTVVPYKSAGTTILPSPSVIQVGKWVDDIGSILADTNETQGKLPTNEIMGSSDKTNKDDDIDAILVDTAAIDSRLPSDPASETNVNANETKIDLIQTDTTAILADTAAIDSRLPSDPADESLQQAAHTQTQSDIAALNDPTVADIADGVWDETQADHVAVGSTGESLDDASSGSSLSVADIADGVWDELIAGHLSAGSTGESLNASGGGSTPSAIADAVWDEALSGHTSVGSTGEAQGRLDDIQVQTDLLPADPASEGNVDDNETKIDLIQSDVTDILADTAAMQPTVATNLDATITSRQSETDAASREVTNQAEHDATQVSTTLILADTAAIDSRLPGDPASETNVDANETKIDLIQTDTTAILADTLAIDARLPSDPADESLQQAAHTQTQADIAALNDPTAGDVADAVWDESQAAHVGVGTTGESLNDASSGGSAPTVADIVDGVWDEVLAGHVTLGTTGHALDEAGGASSVTPGAVADAVWDEAHAGHTVSGSVAETLQAVKDRVG